jgi:competence protein ComEA
MAFGHIYVHILGEVAAPGLYELREGDRAVDAVAAAGGFTTDADQAQLNLARFLVDGEQIVVPAVGDSPAPTGESGGKVNLNSADVTQLQALPRIGPAMAQRIVDWREANGRFASVEDLLSVTGIGAKTFAALKDLVTV